MNAAKSFSANSIIRFTYCPISRDLNRASLPLAVRRYLNARDASADCTDTIVDKILDSARFVACESQFEGRSLC